MDETPPKPPDLFALERRLSKIRELQKTQIIDCLRTMADDIEKGVTAVVDFDVDVEVNKTDVMKHVPGNIALRLVVGDAKKSPFARRRSPKEEPTP